MNEPARTYAAALFDAACENGTAAAVAASFADFAALMEENPAYPAFLNSPAVSVREREAAIDEAFSGRMPAELVSFLKILCRSDAMMLYRACEKEYRQMYQELARFSVARVQSAVPLTEAEKEKFARMLEKRCGHRVELQFETDPALLGGCRVEVDGQLWDGSIKRNLQNVKEVIGNESNGRNR